MKELQRWECVVTLIEDGVVYTQCIDVTRDHKQPEDFIEIQLDQFSPLERATLREGRIFNLVIYEGRGVTAIEHEFSYQRWTQEEIDARMEEARRWADEIRSKIRVEDE